MLIASLRVLYQLRFIWFVEEGGVPRTQVGWVLGFVCLVNLAAHLLGLGSVGGRFGAACLAVVGGCMRRLLGAWELRRCLF